MEIDSVMPTPPMLERVKTLVQPQSKKGL